MDELGKSFPAAESFVDSEQGATKKQGNEYCLNCGTKLQDVFCHHCGQKDIPARQTLSELWTNFISSFWSYEGKFLKTTKYIVTRPGFLAMEYNQGKRESYYHPARMYVFISFVFFLLYFSLPDPDDKNTNKSLSKADSLEVEKIKTESNEFITGGGLDSIMKNVPLDSGKRTQIDLAKKEISDPEKNNKNNFTLRKPEYKTKEAYDSIQLIKPESARNGWLMQQIIYKSIELNQRYGSKQDEFRDTMKKAFMENISKVLFWLLPFFALVFKLLYIRKDYFYSEHLVFSIYYYNFCYLAGSVSMLVEQIESLTWLGNIIQIWILLYLLFAMKRMYLQGWGKTIFKFAVFIFLFSIFVFIGFALSLFSIIATI